MVGRTAEETDVEFGPGFESAPVLNQILIALRKLPDAIGAVSGRLGWFERHQANIFRPHRKVEQIFDRLQGSTEGRVFAEVPRDLTIDEDLPSVLQRLRML
jgi:hypothetical protein